MTRHLVLGRDADVIGETPAGIELVSRIRLRPGFMVHVTSAAGWTPRHTSRPALVISWWIRAVGSDGTTYRGYCRWADPAGPSLPAETAPSPETREAR
ncbi:MAG TPA: hypothetical protein VFV78_10475 [Vicinamibacterales bacterium]|nr:hypothetical protein [Vicinamibacterales bacterium]